VINLMKGFLAAFALLCASLLSLLGFLLVTAELVSLNLGYYGGIIKFFFALAVGVFLIYAWYLFLQFIFNRLAA